MTQLRERLWIEQMIGHHQHEGPVYMVACLKNRETVAPFPIGILGPLDFHIDLWVRRYGVPDLVPSVANDHNEPPDTGSLRGQERSLEKLHPCDLDERLGPASSTSV